MSRGPDHLRGHVCDPDDETADIPAPLVVRCRGADADRLLATEWLLANSIGAYASSTVIGCNTRRYHALLVAATGPPTGRIAALATVMEELTVGDTRYELATNEFPGVLWPRGVTHLTEFRNHIAPTFIYHAGGVELTKEIMLADARNTVGIRYTVRGGPAVLRARPFASLRNYHELRSGSRHPFTFQRSADGVLIRDSAHAAHELHMVAGQATFRPHAHWWDNFVYRADLARGQDATEDLYTPGAFEYKLGDGQSCELTAALDEPPSFDFETACRSRRARLAELAASVGPAADVPTRRLAIATDTFVARRDIPGAPSSATILAGFHWFADWGRDAFISLPGLLLATGRFEKARQVFRTFASHMSDGLIPGRFDDRTSAAHYNSIDAPLWFIIAAERYLQATGDIDFWRELLMPAACAVLTAYHNGTKFDIHADADGLLAGGSPGTQLTWMDAAPGGHAATSRHGKAVEVNALWHSAHRIMAGRCADDDADLAREYGHQAELIASAFTASFWNDKTQCLFDTVDDGGRDASIRPNQIFAVSLPHSALSTEQQAAVVRVVTEKLLTPYGLRTLSPDDQRYRNRYAGSPDARDGAYHQGTAWPFLMGPFIEAYLKVSRPIPLAVAQARHWLLALDDHLGEGGLGFISEIFDGEAPHRHRGCIAQAWSVAEILRARKLIEQWAQRGHTDRADRPGDREA